MPERIEPLGIPSVHGGEDVKISDHMLLLLTAESSGSGPSTMETSTASDIKSSRPLSSCP